MPSSISPSAGSALHPNILLLEEYDALAAAIGSALKKFAPGHPVSVARSLSQAETLASQTRPALLIVDVDPPWPGLTDFFEDLRQTNPETRVLILGAPIPKEIADERASFGALQFVEKPFELADFGAAVQALLGPWRDSDSANSRGTLRALGLTDVVLLQHASGANAVLEVEAGRRDYGEIHFVSGQIFHAEAGKLQGLKAVEEMLSWPEARMREAKRRPSPDRTIRGPWTGFVLEALRAARPAPAVPTPEPLPPQPVTAEAKSIVVIDDTEMLLIFVEDVLATKHPEWRITKASTGRAGCKDVERILPNLVLLDYSLPDINGDEVCRRLLQDERTAQVPILMMSGHVLEMNAAAARFENIVATIEKPFLSDALVDLVQRTLEGTPPRVEIPSQPAVDLPQAPEVLEKAERKPTKEVSAQPPAAPVYMHPAATAVVAKSPAMTTMTAPVLSTAKETVLSLFLDVLSVQFTPQLQMGTIRAKPSSPMVSLHLPNSLKDALPVETGFQLGRTELDTNGHISTMRLIPTTKPLQPVKTRNAFDIGEVAVVPGETRERVRLTPTVTAPMTMQLLAQLELAGVDLSPTFQVAEVILKWHASKVRITFSSKATGGEPQGAAFEITVVQLDPAGRITELLLNPIR